MTVIGCSKARKGEILSASESLHHAMTLYNKEKYLEAQDEFSTITLNFPGSVVVDSAEFYLAESHFAMKEYILAAASYERVITQYPRSALVPMSQFRIGESNYLMSPVYALDQEFTHKAITELQKFIEDYPDHEKVPNAERYLFLCREKLAKKSYTAGELYLKMAAYPSAVMYFDDVLNNYYDTKYAPLALYYKGVALQKNMQTEEARQAFTLFLAKYPDHRFYSRAGERLRALQNVKADQTSTHG